MDQTVKTMIQLPLNGSTVEFDIPFEYLARKFVQVSLVSGDNRRLLVLPTEYRFVTTTRIRTTNAWGPASGFDRIEIRRFTSATDRLVDFADGSILRARDLNVAQIQSIHIAEEARDSALLAMPQDDAGNLDARNRRIVRLAPGIAGTDAINKNQLDKTLGDAGGILSDMKETERDIMDYLQNFADDTAMIKGVSWVYNEGSAMGGETSFTIGKTGPVFAVPYIEVNGSRQLRGYHYNYDPITKVITLAKPLVAGDFVVCNTAEATIPVMDLLMGPTGAQQIGTTSGKTVQQALDAHNQAVTPEDFTKPTDPDHTNGLRLALATGKPVMVNNNITISATVSLPTGARLVGNGSITQVVPNDPNWVWGANTRLSPYPMLATGGRDVLIFGLRLVPVYEGLSVSQGAQDVSISNCTIGGTLNKRSKASAVVVFNCSYINVTNNRIQWCGIDAVWDTALNRIRSGGCRGVDAGGVSYLRINENVISNVGENGIFWYGAGSVQANYNMQVSCGQSGLHFAPHPDYAGVQITGNRAVLCCADGIDIRWTGAGRPRADLVMSDCLTDRCGFLYGDFTKKGIDGSGIATLAFLSHFTITNCVAYNCAGVGAYLQGADDGTISGCTVRYTESASAGVWLAESCSRIRLDNLNVKTVGTALGAGGSQTLTDVSITNSLFDSGSSAVSFPNNSHVRVSTSGNTFVTSKTINLRWDTRNDTVVFNGSTETAVYAATANFSMYRMLVSGTTSAPLVQVVGSQGSRIRDIGLTQRGSGPAIKFTGDNSYLLLSGARLFNLGTGPALQIDDATQQFAVEHSDIYGVSGNAVLTTSPIKNLRYNNNKITGTTSYNGGETPYIVTYSR